MTDVEKDKVKEGPLMLLHLPDIILEKIMSYLTYHEIATFRIICVRYNEINKKLLNRGFHAAEAFHLKCQKEVKGELPRRESERRDHPLAHHCNILSGIETRLSLLNMTFLKYMDAKYCCFIPGKVIDEIFCVLRFVQTTKNMLIQGGLSNEAKISILKELRVNVILKELRDISSMAMEHFEEFIMPTFKTTTSPPLFSFYTSSPPHFSHSVPSLVTLPPVSCTMTRPSELPSTSGTSPEVSQNVGQIKLSKQNKNNINSLRKQVTTLQNQLGESCRKINEQEQVVLELNRVLSEQTSKLADHENKLTEVNRKVVENERKMVALLNLVGNNSIHSKDETNLANQGTCLSGFQVANLHLHSAYPLYTKYDKKVDFGSEVEDVEKECSNSSTSSALRKETSNNVGNETSSHICSETSSSVRNETSVRTLRKRKNQHETSETKESVKTKKFK